jgi:hypothetical protein
MCIFQMLLVVRIVPIPLIVTFFVEKHLVRSCAFVSNFLKLKLQHENPKKLRTSSDSRGANFRCQRSSHD